MIFTQRSKGRKVKSKKKRKMPKSYGFLSIYGRDWTT